MLLLLRQFVLSQQEPPHLSYGLYRALLSCLSCEVEDGDGAERTDRTHRADNRRSRQEVLETGMLLLLLLLLEPPLVWSQESRSQKKDRMVHQYRSNK